MTRQTHKLLVVDDDKRLRELLEKYLKDNGYSVEVAEDGAGARDKLKAGRFDLVVLDVMMPGESGYQLTQSIRSDTGLGEATVPILLLTAMGETDDRIKGLESGADDYMGKPFAPKELLLRIQQILKRAAPDRASTVIDFGGLAYNPKNKTLSKGGEPIYLTSTESELLYLLITNEGVPLSRDDLAERSGITLSPRTIDVQITRLRKKIEKDPKRPEHIKTVRHKGYVFSV